MVAFPHDPYPLLESNIFPSKLATRDGFPLPKYSNIQVMGVNPQKLKTQTPSLPHLYFTQMLYFTTLHFVDMTDGQNQISHISIKIKLCVVYILPLIFLECRISCRSQTLLRVASNMRNLSQGNQQEVDKPLTIKQFMIFTRPTNLKHTAI